MRKISILLQWLILLSLAGFIGYILLRRPPQPEYAPETWNAWEGLTVLSYAGIARRDEPMYPSVQRLEEHLQALREDGYRTVRLEDVAAFLEGRSPLPEKALLLIFEGGRKEAFIRATPLLQRTGFTAVITIPTARMQSWGGFYLKSSDLARLVRLPQWQIGSMGHKADKDIPIDASGATGRFLTRRIWRDNAVEDDDGYQTRVLDDYTRSANLLESATGRPALLYLYPFADAGRHPGADALAESLNRRGVSRHFSLAIVGADDPFNGPGVDPRSLSRLRVPGVWTADRLLAELALSRPRLDGPKALGRSEDWLFERGGTFLPERIALPAGAAAWLRGSDGWADMEIDVTLETAANGIGALYARYAGPLSWLRVSCSDDGLRVQERLSGRLQTLFHHAWSAPPATPVRLKLRLRNNRAWLWLNDTDLSPPLPLAASTRRGRVGFGAEGDRLQVSDFQVRTLPSRLVLANSIRLIPDAYRPLIGAILPVWFHSGETVRIGETQRQDLLQAAVAGIETIPVIRGAAQFEPASADSQAAALHDVLHRQAMSTMVRALALDAPAAPLAAALRERGYRIVHLLPPDLAIQHGRNIAQASASDWIVIQAAGPEAEQALHALRHVMPADRIAVLEVAEIGLEPNIRTALPSHQRQEIER